MASAKLTQVTKQVVTNIVEDVIQLNLTRAEAETLMIISHNVGGRGSGRRGHVDVIQAALKMVGIADQLCHPDRSADCGAIQFRDIITAR